MFRKTMVVCAVLPTMVVACPQAQAQESPAVRYGCDHSHGYKAAAKGLRKALKHHQPLTQRQGRRAWHFILCVRKPRYADALRARRLHWKEWRSAYRNVWVIRFNGLPAEWQGWARATSDCESGGTNDPGLDTGNGFLGPFQFMQSTWASSPGATGTPTQHSWHFQAVVAVRLAWRDGTGHWPNCP